MIVSSSYEVGPAQVDGRYYITEKHIQADNSILSVEYLADETMNPEAIMTARVETINAEEASNG